MKEIKKILTIIIAIAFMTACNTSENQNTKPFIETEGISLITLKNGEQVIVREDFYGTYSFPNWNNYNLANVRMHEIESVDFEAPISRIGNVNSAIVELDRDIPNWLKTDAILSDVNRVQQEYEVLLEERDSTTQQLRENFENLSEKFDELREELELKVESYTAE